MAFFRNFTIFNRGQCTICPVFVVLYSCVIIVYTAAQRSGCFGPLGMESHKIKDSQLSSKTHDSGWDSSEGRLNNGARAWCSDDNTVGVEYFEIDLLKIRHISAIATQGVKYLLISFYVRTYTIMYSFDQQVWFSYQDDTEHTKTFTGNSDANGVKRNNFRSTFVTRYLRIFPRSYKKDMCLRIEVYGCDDSADHCSNYFTSPTGVIRSPGYPASYPPNMDCTWLISVKSVTEIRIALLFTQFDVASGSDSKGCNTDFVSVQSGLTELSSQIGENYCNVYKRRKPMVVMVTSKTARIHFHSDGSSNTHKGFEIAYLLITPGTNDVFGDTACDRHYLMLNCSSSAYTINILHAFYGSYPFSCGQGFTNVICQGSDTKNVITSKCQDLKTCKVFVSGSMFAHSCPDGPVNRQLEVFYQCTSRNIRTPQPPTQGSTISSTIHSARGTFNSHSSLSVTEKTTGLDSAIQSTDAPATNPLETSPSMTSVVETPSSEGPGSSCYGNCAVPQEGDNEGRDTKDKMPSGVIAGVIAPVGVIILIGVFIAVLIILKKRRLKVERSTIPVVEFSRESQLSVSTNNKTGQRCPLSGSTLNTYETVNLLYESGDGQSAKRAGNTKPNVNESYSSPGTAAKDSENPLYESVSPPKACGDNDGYEMVTAQQNTALHEYDSAQNISPSKVKALNNPNYEATLPLKNHEYAVPEC